MYKESGIIEFEYDQVPSDVVSSPLVLTIRVTVSGGVGDEPGIDVYIKRNMIGESVLGAGHGGLSRHVVWCTVGCTVYSVHTPPPPHYCLTVGSSVQSTVI